MLADLWLSLTGFFALFSCTKVVEEVGDSAIDINLGGLLASAYSFSSWRTLFLYFILLLLYFISMPPIMRQDLFETEDLSVTELEWEQLSVWKEISLTGTLVGLKKDLMDICFFFKLFVEDFFFVGQWRSFLRLLKVVASFLLRKQSGCSRGLKPGSVSSFQIVVNCSSKLSVRMQNFLSNFSLDVGVDFWCSKLVEPAVKRVVDDDEIVPRIESSSSS